MQECFKFNVVIFDFISIFFLQNSVEAGSRGCGGTETQKAAEASAGPVFGRWACRAVHGSRNGALRCRSGS